MKMPDALHLLGEADGLVRDHGFFAGRGRPPGDKKDRCVIPYLARKYGVTTRWIAKKLKDGRRAKLAKPLVKSVSYQAGLAAAFAGVRALAPELRAAPANTASPATSVEDPITALKQSLKAFLMRPGRASRDALDLAMGLLDEIKSIERVP